MQNPINFFKEVLFFHKHHKQFKLREGGQGVYVTEDGEGNLTREVIVEIQMGRPVVVSAPADSGYVEEMPLVDMGNIQPLMGTKLKPMTK